MDASPALPDSRGYSPRLRKIVGLFKFFIHTLAADYGSKFCNFLSLCWNQLFPLIGSSQHADLSKGSIDTHSRKLEFLEEYGEEYGYPNGPTSIDELRAKEFARLNGTVYLDHAGATLYTNSQIHKSVEDFSASLYGNPHSQSDSSNKSSDAIAFARQEVLNFFNAPAGEYSCVFTSGATSALKLVGETFPWSSMSNYFYTMENHNSVLGIREYALAAGATATAVDIQQFTYDRKSDIDISSQDKLGIIELRTPQRRTWQADKAEEWDGPVYNLFAFPLECNFSGEKFDPELVKYIQDGRHVNSSKGRWMVLIDAAKGCATSPPDLSKYPVDFVAISFYKIFGYPTGLGALLVRNDSAKKLQKNYFGGGTVAVSIADVDFKQKRESIEQWLEDGTLSFLGIAALQHGFAAINKLGLCDVAKHVGCLTKFTASKLASLRHNNGSNVCILYGKHETVVGHPVSYWGRDCKQGPVVTFNLKGSDGSWIGYREVEKLASLSGIHLRTGCFCNPGACSKYLGLSEEELRANYEAGHVCWDDHDIIAGKPTGAVRASFGYMSTIEDSLALIDFICKFFVDSYAHPSNSGLQRRDLGTTHNLVSKGSVEEMSRMYLESIIIYPIKSCAGFSMDAWQLGDCGLLYDREWLIMSISGYTLTQKKYPLMCLIGTYIDLSTKTLHVTSPNMGQQLEISVEDILQCQVIGGIELCGKRSKGRVYGKEVAEWFTEALGTPCTLLRKEPRSRQVRSRCSGDLHTCLKEGRELSFANEGQFLLVSRASVDDLNSRISSSINVPHKTTRNTRKVQVDVMRFRPNFVISGGSPYEEDGWQSLFLGSEKFSVLGGCNRCQMVNVDQMTGSSQQGNYPLLTLASYRRVKGKILFGLLLAHEPAQGNLNGMDGNHISSQNQSYMKVGCPVYPEKVILE